MELTVILQTVQLLLNSIYESYAIFKDSRNAVSALNKYFSDPHIINVPLINGYFEDHLVPTVHLKFPSSYFFSTYSAMNQNNCNIYL